MVYGFVIGYKSGLRGAGVVGVGVGRAVGRPVAAILAEYIALIAVPFVLLPVRALLWAGPFPEGFSIYDTILNTCQFLIHGYLHPGTLQLLVPTLLIEPIGVPYHPPGFVLELLHDLARGGILPELISYITRQWVGVIFLVSHKV